jgi:hypothetical protein
VVALAVVVLMKITVKQELLVAEDQEQHHKEKMVRVLVLLVLTVLAEREVALEQREVQGEVLGAGMGCHRLFQELLHITLAAAAGIKMEEQERQIQVDWAVAAKAQAMTEADLLKVKAERLIQAAAAELLLLRTKVLAALV